MANYVEEGKVNDTDNNTEIVRWLKTNNLQQLIPVFTQENMTMDELISLGEDPADLKEYLNDLKVPKPSITRICSKIKKLHNKPINDNVNKTISKIVTIVVSQEEEQATNKLSEYKVHISSLIKQLSNVNETVTQNEAKLKSDINAEFNKLINLISNKQESLLKQLHKIAQDKKSVINAKSQQLQETLQVVQNSLKSCDKLLENTNIDKYERKKKILSMVNDILNEKIQEKQVTDVEANIFFQFNGESVPLFVSNLGIISGVQLHPIPVIDDIKCENVTDTKCRVKWNAVLCEQDLNKEINSKLFLKIKNVNDEMDEKEREQLDSELIEFDKNKRQYEHEMIGLKKDTLYKMEMVVFESKERDNENMKERYMKPVLFEFKTKGYDFDSKLFVYESDYDNNGICYFLGCNFGKEEWANPASKGLVKLHSKTGWSSKGVLNDIVGRTYKYSRTDDKEGACVTIDFGDKLKIKPNNYTLMHSYDESDYYLRGWNLEASNDNANWCVLRKHEKDMTLNKKGQSHTWRISNCDTYYQYFRIRMTERDSKGRWYFMSIGFEIYGYLSGNK